MFLSLSSSMLASLGEADVLVVHPFLYTSSSETSVFPARPSSRFSRSVASNVPSRPLRLNCLPAVLSTQYPQSASSAGGHLALRTDCQHAGPVATRVVVACLDEQVAVGQDIDVYADCRGTKGIGDQGQAQSMDGQRGLQATIPRGLRPGAHHALRLWPCQLLAQGKPGDSSSDVWFHVRGRQSGRFGASVRRCARSLPRLSNVDILGETDATQRGHSL